MRHILLLRRTPAALGLDMTVDLYQTPTLLLLVAVVAVFVGLWLRGTSLAAHEGPTGLAPGARRRQLLWLVGWLLAIERLVLQAAGWSAPGWHRAISLSSMLLAPLMFLASLAPQYILRKPRIPFVAAFGLPLIVYCTLVGLNPSPGAMGRVLLLGCVAAGIAVTTQWSLDEVLLPSWLTLGIVALVGGASFWLTGRGDYRDVISLTHSGVLLMTALLFLSAVRRLTAGGVFTVGGLLLWALPPLLRPLLHTHVLPVQFERAVNLAKVIAAVGMIVLVLEEEIAANVAARDRDRRTRREMERYTSLYVADYALDEETAAFDPVCEAIAEASRFSQAVIFMRAAEGRFLLAGLAGVGRSLELALEAMARRTSAEKVESVAAGEHCTPVAGSLRLMNLDPLMEPGDDLQQMSFRSAYVMGIRSPQGKLQGVLMVAGLRQPERLLNLEDVLPLELLAARIGAAREQAGMARRVTQAERLAGLGQLAGGVAHELNNPLQAVTGFAELLVDGEETTARRHAEVILSEARRMKQIIDSLLRFRNAAVAERAPVSIGDVLAETARLVRPELQAAQIELEMKVGEELPLLRADAEQIRQVFVQVVKSAAEAVGEMPAQEGRRIRIETEHLPRAVHVVVSHNGPGFTSPARVFDPFFKPLSPRESAESWAHPEERLQGLGLSVSYAIVREHGGAISAVNLHPTGAAVVVELPLDAEKRDASRASGRPRGIYADEGQTSAR